MKQRRKIFDVTAENDIRYRGPLTYQHLRILGWLFLSASQVAAVLQIGMKINPDFIINGETLLRILSNLADFAMPLFLIANFGVILSARENYKKLIIRFGLLSAAVLGAFFIIYEHYILGLLTSFLGDRETAITTFESVFRGGKGFFAFNLFLDLLLCTLVMCFLNYTPKRVFKGKAVIIFRLFAILPIAYEAASVVLKILVGMERITLPIYVFPFLTTKPPMGFVAFVALAFFFKHSERKFRKVGKTAEEHGEFLGTRTNSLRFSIYTSIILIVTSIIDLIILITIIIAIIISKGTTTPTSEEILPIYNLVKSWGFGDTLPLLFIAPFMMLYSYNKKPKNPNIDIYITIGGVVLIVIVYVECFYQVFASVPEYLQSFFNVLKE